MYLFSIYHIKRKPKVTKEPMKFSKFLRGINQTIDHWTFTQFKSKEKELKKVYLAIKI